ncbi:cellulose synthase family protein [Anthocerotibacter panamensis]|uniref:cellulose synthase family protein n=1 Tax=Anthocerotibacter panamensis TaxID=2857077 RepID=UPI001FD9BB28|nr:cellulose synthase family protein [Anthocerotibacter panamensis]
MPDWLTLLLLVVNSLTAGWLFLYGINAYWLTAHRQNPRPIPPMPTSWPLVTIQLPIYNELYVAHRLLDAVCCLDYPRELLHIQVLDDSTDETQVLLQAQVARYQRQGLSVVYLHRADRAGFKAGALRAAEEAVRGDFVAVFDADFTPTPDWLKHTLPYFADAGVGVVQTRWGHLNRSYSLLTRLQALGIDGHFTVEQQARDREGYWLNFNGTAGIWRMAAIRAAGGWQADTLAEDMDLSYRAQLAGWRLVYVQDIVAPAELPVAISAYKLQQFRWAKGSIQCAKKLLGRVFAESAPTGRKFQALLHLTGYSAHPLMVLILLLLLPLLSVPWVPKHPLSMVWGTLMVPATFGPPLLYLTAQRDLNPKFWHRELGGVLMLAVLGTGISFSNTCAVFAALFNRGTQFRRTPKFNVRDRKDRWQDKRYRLALDWVTLGELALCGYSALALDTALKVGAYGALPFLLLYFFGYGYVAGLTLWQAWQQQMRPVLEPSRL